jgi:hypothetical protein
MVAADPDAAWADTHGHIGIPPTLANSALLTHTTILTHANLDADLGHF